VLRETLYVADEILKVTQVIQEKFFRIVRGKEGKYNWLEYVNE